MSKRVLVLTKIPGIADCFREIQKGYEIVVSVPEGSSAAEYEMIILDPPAFTFELGKEIFSEDSKVKWIHSTYAGVDGLIRKVSEHPELPSYRPILTKTGFYLRYPMFEYVLQHLMNEENLYEAVIEMNSKTREWESTNLKIVQNFRPKDGLRIGILGFGNIGRYIAESLHRTFGCKNFSIFKRSKPKKEESELFQFFDNLEEFLTSKEYDYIISVLPSTPTTQNLLTYELLSKCFKEKKENHTIFMNIGRGDLFKSEDDIIKLIETNVFKKMILDVHKTEPLPKHSKLWDFYPKKIIITPHSAGWSSPLQSALEFQRLFDRYIKKEEMDYLVRWNEGY